jgi:hypothetical protein
MDLEIAQSLENLEKMVVVAATKDKEMMMMAVVVEVADGTKIAMQEEETPGEPQQPIRVITNG